MRPPRRDYEKVPTGIKICGIIEEVQYDENKIFKAFKEGEEGKTGTAIRFKFSLDGCLYPHYSRWMKFNTGEKSNLYKKYLTELVLDVYPNIDIEMDKLNGMKVKTTWSEDGDFQNLETIEADSPKLIISDDENFGKDKTGQELPF